jgi:uncharacterized membrane protein YbaN (DUF454 family)
MVLFVREIIRKVDRNTACTVMSLMVAFTVYSATDNTINGSMIVIMFLHIALIMSRGEDAVRRMSAP